MIAFTSLITIRYLYMQANIIIRPRTHGHVLPGIMEGAEEIRQGNERARRVDLDKDLIDCWVRASKDLRKSQKLKGLYVHL